ncbi:MAG: arginyltransferase [gamma proteobacterium symbiont of Bathyaustriella thionipta]|nr:arginyltransferase [gamma proteobacterium symbiont of Bathyaustriella thionipta]
MNIPCLISHAHTCGYLPRDDAQTLYISPQASLNPALYGALLAQGFRRSGKLVYRPQCEACRQCLSIRIPLQSFQPNRTQRRCFKQIQQLGIYEKPAVFDEEHFALYRNYINTRHADGDMANPDEKSYREFLFCDWMHTSLFEFRLHGKLQMVAVTDVLPQGFSALYTFFDPQSPLKSPGTLAILYQIEEARRRKLQWHYLGYYIAASDKMKYKAAFRPHEVFLHEQWQSSLQT